MDWNKVFSTLMWKISQGRKKKNIERAKLLHPNNFHVFSTCTTKSFEERAFECKQLLLFFLHLWEKNWSRAFEIVTFLLFPTFMIKTFEKRVDDILNWNNFLGFCSSSQVFWNITGQLKKDKFTVTKKTSVDIVQVMPLFITLNWFPLWLRCLY